MRTNRFIPACAGNTPEVAAPASPSSVHPRVCGEHLRAQRDGGSKHRFIPACAGNTATSTTSPTRSTVHPRVCGEHVGSHRQGWQLAGSSPRVRGTLPHRQTSIRRSRFIPACAGNTPKRHRNPPSRPVHPRVCGEHSHLRSWLLQRSGSSPRVRGTRHPGGAVPRQPRFIPACAGNTRPSSGRWSTASVHPRVCGEHVVSAHAMQFAPRFIPACAGNTPTPPNRARSAPVHPRVCGEHIAPSEKTMLQTGSSPRVRGTQLS